jgi:tricorn protease
MYYDIEEREEKNIISGVSSYRLSANGKKILYRSGSTYGIIDVAEGKSVGDGSIAVGQMQVWVNPKEEWEQIFNEAWRIERDFFYDAKMHGIDWDAIKKRYGALVPFVTTRSDLNYVLFEMISELNASHAYVGGGDTERSRRVSVGMLGCDFEPDTKEQRYRISKIYEGGAWDAEVRSPLRRPGVSVTEGDYLLAVNGKPLDTSEDPWAAFQGLAGEVVTLTLNSTSSTRDAEEIVVEPLSRDADFRLRYLAWIEENRKMVDRATHGRVGYLYVPNTGIQGQNELIRQFGAQSERDGLIVDGRFNQGGNIPDRFIEILNRPMYNYWAQRELNDWPTPTVTHTGPKVILTNGWAGSGGDLLPYYFRKADLGPVVGTRTWGGLIGVSGNPAFIDGGGVTAPSFSFFNPDGRWEVEGRGVEPDHQVENLPNELARGHDAQLEKAIDLLKEELRRNPPVEPERPPYPDRSDGTTR